MRLKEIILVKGSTFDSKAVHIQKKVNERGDVYTNCGRWINQTLIETKQSHAYYPDSIKGKLEINKKELRAFLRADCYQCIKSQISYLRIKVVDTPIITVRKKPMS